ncbi:MAG: DUF1153 domain-containing protein [Pseudomonadota bacterium]
MYLKKIDAPRSVTLPDGRTMTQADLPPKETIRWVSSRKAAVVKGVAFGLISMEQAMERWSLSEEELREWTEALTLHGEGALKTTALQHYRKDSTT